MGVVLYNCVYGVFFQDVGFVRSAGGIWQRQGSPNRHLVSSPPFLKTGKGVCVWGGGGVYEDVCDHGYFLEYTRDWKP